MGANRMADQLTTDIILEYTCTVAGHKTKVAWGLLRTRDHIHCATEGCPAYSFARFDDGELTVFENADIEECLASGWEIVGRRGEC